MASAAATAAARSVYCFSQYAKIKQAANCDLQFAKITSLLIEPKQRESKKKPHDFPFFFFIALDDAKKCNKHYYCKWQKGVGRKGAGQWAVIFHDCFIILHN